MSTSLAAPPAEPPHRTRQPVWERLSVRHLWLLAPLAAAVVKAPGPVWDASFLWHVRAGEVQLAAGEVLRVDPFSFTAGGLPWRTQSWVAELGYAVLESWTGGVGWVSPMLAIAGSLTIALVGLAAYRESRGIVPTLAVMVPMAWLATAYLVPRPVLLGNLLLALLVVVLQRGARVRWTVPLLLWLWASLHGSFVVGLGLVALEAVRAGWDRRTAVATLGGSVLAVTCTAHGWRVWQVVAGFAASRAALAHISEWAPPDLTEPPYVVYAVVVAAVPVAASLGRIRPRDLVVAVPFLMFGLTASRAVFPAAVVLAPMVARLGASEGRAAAASRGRPALNWLLAVALLVGALLVIRMPTAPDPEELPVVLSAQIGSGRVFHGDAVGGYLIYARWPEVLVFVDDRAELYGEQVFEDLLVARRGPGWREVFERHGISQALVSREEPLAEVLTLAGWEVGAEDGRYVLLLDPSARR